MRKRIKDAWNVVRHALSVRALLEVVGWKQSVVTVVVAVAAAAWSWRKGVHPAFVPLFFLLGIVLVLFVMIFFRVYRRIPRGDSETNAKRLEPAPTVSTPTSSPEIVLDYHYEDDGTGTSARFSITQPLVVRNISPTIPAYNVEIQAVQVGKGIVTFEDQNGNHLIQYIPPQNSVEVFAKLEEAGQLFQRRLPDFLNSSYQDSSLDELFGTQVFPIHVRFAGAASQMFERTFDLEFVPWRKQVRIGRVTHALLG